MATPHTLHEWRDRAEDGEHRYFRAWKGHGKWHFLTTLKSEPDWLPLPDPNLDFLTALREKLFDKYQRRRVPWEQVQEIDRMIEAKGGTPGGGETGDDADEEF